MLTELKIYKWKLVIKLGSGLQGGGGVKGVVPHPKLLKSRNLIFPFESLT